MSDGQDYVNSYRAAEQWLSWTPSYNDPLDLRTRTIAEVGRDLLGVVANREMAVAGMMDAVTDFLIARGAHV